MHLDDSAVQGNRLDLDAHDLSMLQLFKNPIQYATLGPAIHARVDRVPIAEAFGADRATCNHARPRTGSH